MMIRHLTEPFVAEENCSRANEGNMDKPPHPRPSTAAPRTTIQVWLCDVCGKQYRDFEEACHHEDKCRKEKEIHVRVDSATAIPQERTHDPLVSNALVSLADTAEDPKTNSTASKSQTSLTIDKVKQSTAKSVVSPKPAPTGRPKRQATIRRKPTEIDLAFGRTPSKKRQLRQAPTAVKPLADARKATKNDKARSKKASMASIFSKPEEQKAALAEHRAAEFMAKRRADAQCERERQQRRIQAKKQRQAVASDVACEVPVSTVRKSRSYPAAVPFPVPSHVGIGEVRNLSIEINGNSFVTQQAIAMAQSRLSCTTRHPAGGTTPELEGQDDVRLLPLLDDPILHASSDGDPLMLMLSTLLTPPTRKIMPLDSSLWSDKYGIHTVPDDVCSAPNKKIAERMLTFVEDWKVDRRRAHQRRAERQKALLNTKKRKRKTTYNADLWEDSDDEECGLCNLCLVTGPIASGKTALVHAVAKQSDCLVLEISTAEKRSGAALKHAIEEATQSHSSLDMLKNSGCQEQAMALVDSDDEMNELEQGSSVVVILIDEVDNIYDDYSDNGFWAALSTVAKRAKCPIFLTANTIPANLQSCSARFSHLETTMPLPTDCTSSMWRALKEEGFALRSGQDTSSIKDRLADVAKLCGCDLRRILNELQLFARAADKVHGEADSNDFVEADAKHHSVTAALPLSPVIVNVFPKVVRPDTVTLLTIKGMNFLSLASSGDPSCEVLVGGRPCPAVQILDDHTLFAACPPCALPITVDDECVFSGTFWQCHTARYASLTLRSKRRDGIVSTTEGTVWNSQQNNGTGLAFSCPWNIEYGFPPPRYESSLYLHGTAKTDYAPVALVLQSDAVIHQAQTLLANAVHIWYASVPGMPIQTTVEAPPQADESEISEWGELYSRYARASDSAVLDDALIGGTLPYLAGSVPGFGSDLVDDAPTGKSDTAKKRAKTHTFERLHELGWNDNSYFFGDVEAYFTQPPTSKERRLIARDEAHGRGEIQTVRGSPFTAASYDLENSEEPSTDSEHSGFPTLTTVSSRSHEDMFLPGYVPSVVSHLPALLRYSMSPHDKVRLALLPIAIRGATKTRLDLLSQIVHQDDHRRLLSPAFSRVLSNLESSMGESSSRVHLDYISFLCIIANLERAAECSYQKALASNPEMAALLQGDQRRTRRAKNLYRPHHFIVGGLHDDDSAVNEFGSDLADALLRFRLP